jgi:NAD(P)H-hydrate repair Nnr-like enzyme with NAD(P)H-hydrate epimerase domain
VVRSGGISGESGDLLVAISLPSAYHFTKGANSRYEVEVEPAVAALSVDAPRGSLRDSGSARIRFKRTGAVQPGTTLTVSCKVNPHLTSSITHTHWVGTGWFNSLAGARVDRFTSARRRTSVCFNR